MEETPRERFVRLASKRVNAVLQRLDILGNCSNSQYYEYTEEDIKEIFRAIESRVREIKGKFDINKGKKFEL